MNLLELSTLISDEVEADEGLAREDFDIKNVVRQNVGSIRMAMDKIGINVI